MVVLNSVHSRQVATFSLHEARHTYASFLMAAGYNLLGPVALVTTARYVKNLPIPRGTTEGAKLETYLEQEIGDI